ncbi:MAG: hypothetical protein KIH01_05745 [Candidatus Freyarchaeota archaeon]|nr:hypothetical protein [Candidatus Jordarchaeia archaeon]
MLSDMPYEVTNPVDTLEVLRHAEGAASSKVLIERYRIFKKRALNVLTVNSSLASKVLDAELIFKFGGYAAKIIGFNDDGQFKGSARFH